VPVNVPCTIPTHTLAPHSTSYIATSSSSTTSTSAPTSDLNSSFIFSSISTTTNTLPVATTSPSISCVGYSDPAGLLIPDLVDPVIATTVTAPASTSAISPTFALATLSSVPALGSASATAFALVPIPEPTLAAAPAPVAAPVLLAVVAGSQVYGGAPIRLLFENLDLLSDGWRAAASHKVHTLHMRQATLDPCTWIRAANVACPRSWKTVRGHGMLLTIDLEGETCADVRLEAHFELERLLPFIEVLRLSSRHCALLPTLFDAPAPLLRHLDPGCGTMPMAHAPGPLFSGSASRLTTLAASSTALGAAVSHSSFWTNTAALKNVRVYPDVVGTVRTAALQEAVRWHALDMVDVRGALDSTGTVDFIKRFTTGVIKLSMRSLATFCDMGLRMTAESICGVAQEPACEQLSRHLHSSRARMTPSCSAASLPSVMRSS